MNPSDTVYVITAAVLFGMGMYGVLVAGHLMRKLLALNLMGVAVFLMLIAVGRRGEGGLDPVPQAMVLTGIVVAVSATAFALALMLSLYRRTGRADLDALDLPDEDRDIDWEGYED
jgi:multicomponent Na+:H+ antiporter subunit C